MKPLIETNPYLRDPEIRERMLRRSVLQSSYFEGARNIKLAPPVRKPRRKASARKRPKGS
ncbi:MAG TPA: hypothetical protein VH253_16950 [Phycisphaerae bacterium]|nr:hypothetical protein [Phycisphaerae bacterium]